MHKSAVDMQRWGGGGREGAVAMDRPLERNTPQCGAGAAKYGVVGEVAGDRWPETWRGRAERGLPGRNRALRGIRSNQRQYSSQQASPLPVSLSRPLSPSRSSRPLHDPARRSLSYLHPVALPNQSSNPLYLQYLPAYLSNFSSLSLTERADMDSWRVAVLGDGGVGKTALAVQTYDPTIEDAYRKQLVVDNRMCFVEVIDTAGQEEYAALRDQWVREGQAFILVYSIASRATFDRLEVFRQSMMRVKRQKPIFMLVGNKSDKAYEREVSREEGQAMARTFGCEFLETSAKTAQNVERLFTSLVRMLRNMKQTEQGVTTPGRPIEKPVKRKCIIM
ncbi:hypothetical protein EW146_g3872 [Bondarzewia mesenterica]|uniref:Ras protein n=1 Tax=Bondarzewia mesenterica TaxID=1095465 RepID=A0A4S4LWA0_9AGAM|nr:hypothetical protein EW146_g3872 [Bondarzewia mesenterica]